MKINWPALGLLALGAYAGRSCFPRVERVGRFVPVIKTVHDTIHVPVKWIVHDTVHHFTSDTFNLVIRETVHDTVFFERSDSTPIWNVFSYEQTARDTARIRTLESGSTRGAVLQVYTPGPLTGLFAGTSSQPRLSFGEWPRNRTPTLTKLAWGAGGFTLCTLANMTNNLSR